MKIFPFLRIFLLAIGLAAATNALAVQCEGQDLKEIQSLKSLPAEVLTILRNQGNGYEIADRGDEYQKTDTFVGRPLPFRRFALAGVTPHCAIVAIEHGGRGYSVENYRLRLSGGNWEIVRKGSSIKSPSSLDELSGSVVMNIVRDPATRGFRQMATPLLN